MARASSSSIPFRSARRGVAVDHQRLDLEELEAAVGGHVLVAEAAARRDDPDRRRQRLHGPDLHRRGVGAQDGAVHRGHGRVAAGLGDVQRVPQVARRMVGRDVERFEVPPLGLDLRALEHLEAEGVEDLAEVALGGRAWDAGDRCAPARRARSCPARSLSSCASRAPAVTSARRAARADSISTRTSLASRPKGGPLLRRRLAQRPHQPGQRAGSTQQLVAQRFDCGGIGAGGQPRLRVGAELLEAGGEVGHVHRSCNHR